MNQRNTRILTRLLMMGLAVLLIFGDQAYAAQETIPPAFAAAMEKLPESLRQNQNLQIDLKALFTTYGTAIKGADSNTQNQVYLIMQDGQKLVYDDSRTKSFDEKLNHPDLEDMLSQLYRPGKPTAETPLDHDPGRIRVEAFLNAVYGAISGQVQGNFVPVNFAGATVSFNSKNGAAAALAKVGQKLSQALACNPGLRACLFPLGGSYNRRSIAALPA